MRQKLKLHEFPYLGHNMKLLYVFEVCRIVLIHLQILYIYKTTCDKLLSRY